MKPGETSSVVAYSGLSTEVSSVSSDNIISVQKTTIHKTTVDNKPSTGNSAGESRLNHSDCDQKVSNFFNCMHEYFEMTRKIF